MIQSVLLPAATILLVNNPAAAQSLQETQSAFSVLDVGSVHRTVEAGSGLNAAGVSWQDGGHSGSVVASLAGLVRAKHDQQYVFARANARIERRRQFKALQTQAQAAGLMGERSALDLLDARFAASTIAVMRKEFAAREAALASAKPGSIAYTKALRELAASGYYLAWSLADGADPAGGEQIVALLTRQFAPFAADPPADLLMPFAWYHWLKANVLEQTGDKTQAEAERKRTLALTERPEAYPADFPLIARMKARTLYALKSPGSDFGQRACDLYAMLAAARPFDIVAKDGYAQCVIDQSWVDGNKNGRKRAAVAALDVLQEYMNSFSVQHDALGTRFSLYKIAVLSALTSIENDPPFTRSGLDYKIMMSDIFVSALDGVSYPLNNRYDVTTRYGYFSDLYDVDAAAAGERDAIAAKSLALFSRIAAAIEPTRQVFPTSPNYAHVSLHAHTKMVQALVAQNNAVEARRVSDAGMKVYRQSPILARFSHFEEGGEIECGFLKQRIELVLGSGDLAAAEQTYRAMARGCGTWLIKYPWDFYSRAPFAAASLALGRAYHAARRYGDAAPLLTYASNWGANDASFFLADMYRTGHGVQRDNKRATILYDLAAKQSLKRFTAPAVFDTIRLPFSVYVMQYGAGPRCTPEVTPRLSAPPCVGFDGIDDQVLWIKEARSGEVPKDVVESFRRLDTIARKNNVSLPALAVYALASSTKEPTAKGETAVRTAKAVLPLPITDAAPEVTESRFLAGDFRKQPAHLVETRVVPAMASGSCLGWVLKVKSEDRQVRLQQIFDYPRKPVHLPDSADSHIGNGGRQWTLDFTAPLNTGVVSKQVCLDDGDPIGPYHVEVRAGTKRVYSADFEVAPDDGLYEWKAEAAAAQPPTDAEKTKPDKTDASIDENLLSEKVVLLLRGENAAGAPTFTYLQLTLRSLKRLRDRIMSMRAYEPKEFGTVLAEGSGTPSAALRRRMAEQYNVKDVAPPRSDTTK